MDRLVPFLIKVNLKICYHAEKYSYPYKTFGIFGALSYPMYYCVWLYTTPGGYESFSLRLLVVVLCIPLIFVNRWPEKVRIFLPIYWYCTMLYCLPFLFTFMVLKNNLSAAWALNGLSVVALSVLLLDLIPLYILTAIGVSLGYLCFHLASPSINLTLHADVLVTYGSIFIFGALFAHRKDIVQQEKIKVMKSLSATVAHELRTPLRTIDSCATGVRDYLPILLDTYGKAEKIFSVPYIAPMHSEALSVACDTIESEIRASFTVIDMLLANVSHEKINDKAFKHYSIGHCVELALHRFPFDDEERKKIFWRNQKDFIFNGDETLIVHVLFNLLKNSLYAIKAARKGEIHIWTESIEKNHMLHFKDTGSGIPVEILPRIFDAFFTQTMHGSGIGLGFCRIVMDAFGGKIKCYSEKGKYTHFTLSFPVRSTKKISHTIKEISYE